MRPIRRGDRGMVVVFAGITVMMLLTITALVVDLSFLRNDRRVDQKVADAAASAGAVQLALRNGRAACVEALAYLESNLPDVESFSGAGCSGFPLFCTPATSPATTTGTAGGIRITIVHPVPDSHALMHRASAIGAPTSAVLPADGSRCDRIAISISYQRPSSFGTVLGVDEQSTTVHTVARASTTVGGRRPINVLILERRDCSAVVVDGQPSLVVGAITGHQGELLPGILAVDSDGSGTNCNPTSNGTLHAQGSTALARADGPPFCPGELSAGTGQGCGIIELYAPGVPGPATPLYCELGAYRPACTSTARIRPHPVRMAARRTRSVFDHRFNCLSDYSTKPWYATQPIGPCPNPTGSTDYVDELYSFAGGSGTPAGFSVYGDTPATEPCTVEGTTSIVVPEGNVRVACSTFTVKRPVTFTGGNVIFDGDVVVTSAGDLRIHACGREGVDSCNPAQGLTWDEDARGNYTEAQYSSDAAWVFFRSGGGFQKDASAQVRIHDSSIFLPANADTGASRALAMSGGSGSLVWHAPREGPFDVLAMWSDATLQHDLGGQSLLEMEGVYFAPDARLTFRGTGGQDQVAAQLVSEQLTVSGGGTLHVVPDIDRSLAHYEPAYSVLIR